jgi:hypothetical protein
MRTPRSETMSFRGVGGCDPRPLGGLTRWPRAGGGQAAWPSVRCPSCGCGMLQSCAMLPCRMLDCGSRRRARVRRRGRAPSVAAHRPAAAAPARSHPALRRAHIPARLHPTWKAVLFFSARLHRPPARPQPASQRTHIPSAACSHGAATLGLVAGPTWTWAARTTRKRARATRAALAQLSQLSPDSLLHAEGPLHCYKSCYQSRPLPAGKCTGSRAKGQHHWQRPGR